MWQNDTIGASEKRGFIMECGNLFPLLTAKFISPPRLPLDIAGGPMVVGGPMNWPVQSGNEFPHSITGRAFFRGSYGIFYRQRQGEASPPSARRTRRVEASANAGRKYHETETLQAGFEITKKFPVAG
jgi:hypothetical protein